MKALLFICLIPAISLQSQNRFACAGFGNYEAFNIAMKHQGKKVIYRYGYGSDLNIYGQGFYHCVFGSIGKTIMKFDERHALSLHGRVMVWNLENRSNIFTAAAFAPLIQLTRKYKRFEASAYVGYVYSSVFRYRRKSYYEIGWPKEWQPDFGVSINYCLTCR